MASTKSRSKSKSKAKPKNDKPEKNDVNRKTSKQSSSKSKASKTATTATGRPKKSAADKKAAVSPSQKRKTREQAYRQKDIKTAKKRLSQRLSVGTGHLLKADEWTPIDYQLSNTGSFLEEKDAYRGDFVDPDKDYIDPGKRNKSQPMMLERKKSKKANQGNKNKQKAKKQQNAGADKAKKTGAPNGAGADKGKTNSNAPKSKQASAGGSGASGSGNKDQNMSLLQGIQNAKLKKTDTSNGNGKLDMSKYQNLSHVSLNIHNQNRLLVEDVDASIKHQNHLKATPTGVSGGGWESTGAIN